MPPPISTTGRAPLRRATILAALALFAVAVPGVCAASASASASTPVPAGGVLVEPVTHHNSSTRTPRSSTSSSTDKSDNSLSITPGGTAARPGGPPNPVTIDLDEVSPPTPGGSTMLSVSGQLITTVGEPLAHLSMSLWIGARVTSRGQLATLTDDPAAARTRSYRQVVLANGDGTQPLAAPPIQGAAPVPFRIAADRAALDLPPSLGVYPVQLRITGSVGGRAVVPIGAAYTFLVWAPNPQQPRTPVAAVLPIADQPRLRSDGRLTDNALADEVKPGGRLSRLLTAATPPVTLAVDPTLVQALTIMAQPGGYDYATPGGPVHAQTDANAALFLSDIVRFAEQGGVVFALPYGDADLTALVRARKLDTVKYAVKTGEVVLAHLLGRDPLQKGTIAYPADGSADATTADILRQLEVGTVILDDQLLPSAAKITYTPSATVSLATSAGPIQALAADSQLTRIATAYTGLPDGPDFGTALARLRAELGMITAERPEQRFQILALPRDWDPPSDWARSVLDTLTSGYSTSVGLDAGVGGQSRPDDRPGRLAYPAEAQARELPTDYLTAVEDVLDEVQALSPVLCPPRRGPRCQLQLINPMKNTLVTATSAAWRGDRRVDGVSLSQQVDGEASAIRNGIQVVASRSVNLTSRRGLVPITLENNTQYEVTVVLAFSSTDRSRLRSPARQTLRLPPGQKAQVEIEMEAEGAGTFPLEIRKLNLDGQALSTEPPNRVLVRSTVYGAVATAITIGAVGVLLLAVVIRLARRLRARLRGAKDDLGGPAGPHEAATGPA
ncbi:DUF6049 family protein, partial [Frankia sp. CcWB3]